MPWWNRWMPNEYVSSYSEIDLERLWKIGYRLILTDLDNTLVPWNSPDVQELLATWLKDAQERGFSVCIVSNNHGPRVSAFGQAAHVPFIGSARKPRPDAFLRALQRFHTSADQAVMIGDQLFTDIGGGNRAGLYTILVDPIHPREWWGTRVVRIVERRLLRWLERKGLHRQDSAMSGRTGGMPK